MSWRPRDTLTLSADLTRTTWSEARILDYFDLAATARSANGVPVGAARPRPSPRAAVPHPARASPTRTTPTTRCRLVSQHDAEQIRVGLEWVLIKGRLKVPLRAGYFNDRQIIPNPDGNIPRFNGFTVGTGLILGSMLLDVAYVHEFGDYHVTEQAAAGGGDLDAAPDAARHGDATA